MSDEAEICNSFLVYSKLNNYQYYLNLKYLMPFQIHPLQYRHKNTMFVLVVDQSNY